MKFINLLKKELIELINKQMIFGLVITCLILMAVGSVMGSAIDSAEESVSNVNLCDMDNTEFTKSILSDLKAMNVKVKQVDSNDFSSASSPEKAMKKYDISGLIVIPKGFTDTIIKDGKIASLQSYSILKSASSLGSVSSDTSSGTSLIQNCIQKKIMAEKGLSESDITTINSPVTVSQNTIVNNKSAEISIQSIIGNMTTKNMIIPIVIFILVIYTSQMIIGAVSTEKIDKTLETLLSAPVSRSSVIGAKMLAAAIVALINAAVYMFGFTYFVADATSSLSETTVSSAVGQALSTNEAMNILGLNLNFTDYILIGIQMFLTIMISLSISIILGAMANDAKSAQTLIMPIMLCAMIPYLISMVSDINSLSPVLRTIIYAIPFTHTFTAISNLMFGNTTLFAIGIIYQTLFFCVCMFFALKLFKSDKIFTSSLNFGQKSKFKNKNNPV